MRASMHRGPLAIAYLQCNRRAISGDRVNAYEFNIFGLRRDGTCAERYNRHFSCSECDEDTVAFGQFN